MDQALSLKTGEFFSADKASYASSKNMLLVCPECGEPVYFKARETPYVTPFFAHYKELETVKLAKNCSLRIMGSTFQKASCLLPNISQGQLVDKCLGNTQSH
jgi:DNA-directed RNA polymerase subunit RPC12/RpoP